MRLTAADIQDLALLLSPYCLISLSATGFPSPVVFVAAIAIAAVTVPIIGLILLGLEHAMDFIIHHAVDILSLSLLCEAA